MKRTNFYLSFQGFMQTLAITLVFVAGLVSSTNAQVAIGGIGCKTAINVQLSPAANPATATSCTTTLTTIELYDLSLNSSLAGSYNVFVKRGNLLFNSAVVNAGDIGHTVQALLTNGTVVNGVLTGATQTCWTNVTVEDKAPPVVVCPANVTIKCGSSTLPQFTGDFGIDGYTVASDGSFADCTLSTLNAHVSDESYTDAVTGAACPAGTPYFVTRTWTLTDHYGNASIPCTQTITYAPVLVANYVVDSLLVSCTATDLSPAGLWAAGYRAPNKSAYPYYLTDTLVGSTACVQETYTDLRMDICPGSYMIMRTWKLFYCGTPYLLTQVINVTNTTPPAATIAFTDYTSSGDYLCYRDLWGNINKLPANLKCKVTPRSFPFGPCGGDRLPVANFAKGNPYGCVGDASFLITVTPPACGNPGIVTVNDSRFTAVGGGVWVANGLPFGSTYVTFTVTDPCSGLKSCITVNVVVTDNVLPEPVCITQTKVSIGSDGKVRMPASALNSGSHDNCGIYQIFASRMDQKAPVASAGTASCGTLVSDLCAASYGGKDNRIWSDWVEFGCADLGKIDTVLLGVLDNYGNFNFCMVQVTVDNKVTPTCIPPQSVTIDCRDAATALTVLCTNTTQFGLGGKPTAWTNCGSPTISLPALSGSLDNCKKGTYTRTWTVTDCAGANPVTCSQTVTFKQYSDFVVDFPDDITVSCLSAVPAADSLRNQMLDPASWDKLDGAILNRGCGVIAVNIQDQAFTANPGLPTLDVCGKIIRQICVIDWCKFNPNDYTLDGYYGTDNFGNPVLGDVHGYAGNNANYANVTNIGSRATNLATWGSLDGYRPAIGPVGDYNYLYLAQQGVPTSSFNTGSYVITQQDRRFEDGDVYGNANYGPQNYAGIGYPANIYSFNDGIICFAQIIKIVDKEAPKSTTPDTVVCDYGSGTQCYGLYKYQLVVTDGCGGRSTNFPNGNGGVAQSIRTTWYITNAAGTKVAQSAVNDFSGLIYDYTTGLGLSLPYGVYTVTYTATDLCMNILSPVSYKLTIKDCKTPSLNCYATYSVLMNSATPGQGTVQAWAREILSSAADNCTSEADLKAKATITAGTATAPGTASYLQFTCDDYIATAPSHIISAKVWISDAAGNTNNCFVNIQLQDNNGACTRPVVGALSGVIGTENKQAVPGVTVNANIGSTVSGSSATTTDGSYSINSLALGANLQTKAAKANMGDRATDVTTWDIALVSQHVLGIKALGSAYKIIAADVDKSGEVDATDMLHMRRFILGITSSLPAGTWRFVDKSYAFKNAANPFGEDFPEYVNVNAFANGNSANFVAIEIGDVNASYESVPSAQVRTAKTVTLNVDDINVVAGNEYTVNVTASELNASALQGTFSFDGATVTALKPGNLNGIADANFNVKANAVATSWNGEAAKDVTVASFTIRADKSGKLSDMLSFGSAITKSEANDAQGNVANVTLKFNTGKVSGGEFALYQNTPNPVENSTKIGFNLPSDQTARLTVIAVDGKVMLTKSISGKAGYNEVSINKTELNASGVFHYRLDTQDNSATKKMIIIE